MKKTDALNDGENHYITTIVPLDYCNWSQPLQDPHKKCFFLASRTYRGAFHNERRQLSALQLETD
jgi:hypothetical protein